MATTSNPITLQAAKDVLAKAGYTVTPPPPVPYVEHVRPVEVVDGGRPSPEQLQLDVEMHHLVTLAVGGTGEFGQTTDGRDYRYAIVNSDRGGYADVLAKATTADQLVPYLQGLAVVLDNADQQAELEAADDRISRQAR